MADFSKVKQYNGEARRQPKDNTPALMQMLKKNMNALRSVLPKHISPERMARVSLNVVRHNPKLMQCAPETLLVAIMEASTLGLEIDMRGQAYLVPFWNKKTQTYDVQLMPGYRGLVDLAYRSGKIQSIQAAVVGENDKFDFALGLKPRLEHIPNLQGRGAIIAAYAIAIMKDGATQFEVMSLEELEKVRNASRSKDDGPWNDWTEQMMVKTVVKRLCKLLPLSPEVQRAVSLDDAIDAGVAQSLGETLDSTLVEIPMPQPEAIEATSEGEGVELNMEPAPEKEAAPVEHKEEKAEQPKAQDVNYEFTCPKTERKVTEDACKFCKERKGCPAWEAI